MTPAKNPAPKAKAKPKQKPEPSLKPRDPGRFLSQSRLSEVLGKNRTTIRDWQAKEMPCIQRGDVNTGRNWLYDLAAVVAWREEQVAAEVRAELRPSAPDDGTLQGFLSGLEGADLVAAQERLLKLAERQKYAVNPDAVNAIFLRAYRDIGNGLMGIPNLALRDMGGFNDDLVRRFTRDAKAMIDVRLKAAGGWVPPALTDEDRFFAVVAEGLAGYPQEMIDRFVRVATVTVPSVLKSGKNFVALQVQDLISGENVMPDIVDEPAAPEPVA